MKQNAKSPLRGGDEETRAEQIEREMACAILRGDHEPGSRLPSVRDLATEHEVTVPTIQRALDRLGRVGLVTAKRGSGITVDDPRRNMNLSLIPLWFEALSGRPKEAAKILGDFLELRRVVAAHLFATASHQLLGALPALMPAVIRLAAATDLYDIARADAALTRAVVEKMDNFALNAIFHTVETIALEVPYIAESLYGDRDAHQAVITQVVASFASAHRSEASRSLQEALKRWDEVTTCNYAAHLSRARSEES